MNFQPYLAYSASAGSGKTFALAARYISLLFMGEPPGSILAATFTNKAAAEMRQRVVDSLRNLDKDEAFLQAISDQTGLSRDELKKRQPEVLARFLASSSHIVTLDSFFASILRSASLEIGLEPDFVTKELPQAELEEHFLDEVQAQGLLASLVKLAMDIEDKRFTKIFDLLSGLYKIDPLLPEPPKVEGSLQRIAEQCETVRLEMIEALNDAGSAVRCIKQFETKSVKELFDKKLFEHALLGDHSWFTKSINGEIESIYERLRALLHEWARAKEQLVLHNLFAIYDYFKNATISQAKSSGVLSFDDLSYFTYRLLHESLSREFLYFKIDTKFKHILLDEFQDTSTLQFLLLKPMIDEIFSGVGQSEFKSFFYVGDIKQSLYRFRGGVEELFDKVAERYDITIEPMDTNYRSSRSVVGQVNRWFETTMPDYVAQKSCANAAEGYVEVIEAEAIIDEAVEQAKKLLELGVDVDDIAFLVATNKDGQALHEACEQSGIPTLLKTSSSLKHMPKIAALVAMLSYLYAPERIDAEALLQRVGKPMSKMELDWYSAFMQPLEVLDGLVREFGYFDDDKNILKLLEFAGSFGDIPTFLEEFESSTIPLAEHSVHGAQIMTIHGSKGLEFGYVIVLDKLTRKKSDTSPLIFHYDEKLHVDEIFYRTRGREHFDNRYAQMIEEKKRSSTKDSKNVLYVALTRAAEALIVIRKEKDSIFDEIGIAPMKTGALAGRRVQGAGDKEQGAGSREQVGITLTHYGTQELVSGKEEEEKDYNAMLFGTALHYTLEIMGGFDEAGLANALISLRNRYGMQLESTQIEQIACRIDALIEHKRFQELLDGARVTKECTLSFDGELKQIDLLLEYEDRCVVVDYKSSKKFTAYHTAQVGQYAGAIRSLTGKPTKAVIAYLLDSSVEMVEL